MEAMEAVRKSLEPKIKPYTVRLWTSSIDVRDGPGLDYKANRVFGCRGLFTIVEESQGKGAKKWGRLKSGDGWIPLDFTEIVKEV